MIYGFWEAQLGAPIKTKIAGMKFNKDTYKEMFKLANEAWLANGGGPPAPAVVAAVAAASSSSEPSTSDSSGQVAAIRGGATRGARGGRGGLGGRGNRGGGRGGSAPQSYNQNNQSQNNQPLTQQGSKPHQKGPKHPDLPAKGDSWCAQHWRKGRSAPYCTDPHVCEWANVVAPRTA